MQTTTRSDRRSSPANALPITLGIDRTSITHNGVTWRSSLRAVVDFLITPPGRPMDLPHAVVQSSEPALLLTEADFAPPEPVLATLLRIAASIALAVALGGAAYVAGRLIS